LPDLGMYITVACTSLNCVKNMSYCPKCGKEVNEDATYCTHCGATLRREAPTREFGEYGEGAMGHLSLAFNLVMAKPMVFVPAILGGVISTLIGAASGAFFGISSWAWGRNPLLFPASIGLMVLGIVFAIISGVAIYVLNFASIDMSRDAYVDEPLDLMGSVNYALRRIGTFIIASIIGAILAITIILIPVVIFMFVIIVVDETGIGDAISKALSAIGSDFGDVIIVIIVAIVGSAILGWVPVIGGLLTTALNVVIGLAFMDIYFRYRQARY